MTGQRGPPPATTAGLVTPRLAPAGTADATSPGAPLLRTGWQRAAVERLPSRAEVAALVHPVSPGADVLSVVVLSGGLSNTNLRVELDREPFRLLLRFYQRDPAQADKERALAALLHQRGVPAARMLHLGAHHWAQDDDSRAALFEWIEGERLDLLAPQLDGPALRQVAARVGGALAATHAIHFPSLGFLDAQLHVAHPIALDAAALLGFLDERLLRQGGAGRLGVDLAAAVIAFASRRAGRLADWPSPPCLVHADCNPSNLLVRAGDRTVTALLDWEFALSAIPALDFATLLRPGASERTGFTTGLAEGYRAGGGSLPTGWEEIARLADLFAWADMLSRPGADEALARDARRVMRRLLA